MLADREFVGEAWFCWLQQQRIPFHQRLKRNTLVPDTDHRPVRLDALFGTLAPGQCQSLPGRRPVWGCFVHLVALPLEDGDCLFIASSSVPPAQALDAYADRWLIETLFGCLKSRGFNLEKIHLTDPQRLSKLMGLLTLAFVWAYRTGMLLHDMQQAILLKNSESNP